MLIMKTRCVELSRLESELLREYIPVAAVKPLPASLCRSIYRRLEGLPVFEAGELSISATVPSRHVRITDIVN